ncbi:MULTISPECIES: collagen binding domain-containing protein [unclassified Neglectibacter]|uniref:MSCRAMM family protein n=1 Tax=unclassified Neglectibacter TaxID=2632164 RepID=UPI001370D6B9|nr:MULTISPECIES: SpaA isopeptide-forming pilin-related protein [unclassified Neglectibacter]
MKDAIATAQTSHDGSFIFANMPYGKYLLVELESLPGYVLLKDAIPVEMDADEVRLSDIINEKGKISITKVDADTGKPLAGAKLQILDKDGKVVEEWASDEKAHVIALLPVGDYVLHEEAAPQGYAKAEDIRFTVKEDTTTLELVMKDKPTGTTTTTTVPNTGDFGWIAVLAALGLSLLGAGLAVFFGRKK